MRIGYNLILNIAYLYGLTSFSAVLVCMYVYVCVCMYMHLYVHKRKMVQNKKLKKKKKVQMTFVLSTERLSGCEDALKVMMARALCSGLLS